MVERTSILLLDLDAAGDEVHEYMSYRALLWLLGLSIENRLRLLSSPRFRSFQPSTTPHT